MVQTEKQRIDMIFGDLGIIDKNEIHNDGKIGDIVKSPKSSEKTTDEDPNSINRAGAYD